MPSDAPPAAVEQDRVEDALRAIDELLERDGEKNATTIESVLKGRFARKTLRDALSLGEQEGRLEKKTGNRREQIYSPAAETVVL